MRLAQFFEKYSRDDQVIGPTVHMNQIRENLWLGNLRSRENQTLMKHFGISVVISVLTEWERNLSINTTLDDNFIEYKIELDDSVDANLVDAIQEANRYLDHELARGNRCLVHCMVGSSRSASIIIAYLIHSERFSYDQAYDVVKVARPSISPNGGFVKILKSL